MAPDPCFFLSRSRDFTCIFGPWRYLSLKHEYYLCLRRGVVAGSCAIENNGCRDTTISQSPTPHGSYMHTCASTEGCNRVLFFIALFFLTIFIKNLISYTFQEEHFNIFFIYSIQKIWNVYRETSYTRLYTKYRLAKKDSECEQHTEQKRVSRDVHLRHRHFVLSPCPCFLFEQGPPTRRVPLLLPCNISSWHFILFLSFFLTVYKIMYRLHSKKFVIKNKI